jgi:hypothetical protein
MVTAMHGWSSSEAALRTPLTGAAERAARPARIPVSGVKHFMLSDLSPVERTKLVDDAYRINLAYFTDDDREGFEKAFFSGDTTWVFTFHAADGLMVGFSAISCMWVSHEGKEHAVFKGMVSVDARYKLIWRSRLPVLLAAARFKLRHPWTPAGYMGMAATPSGYRLAASSVPRVYPSRREPMPESIKALLLKTTRLRGHEPVDEERLLVPAMSRLAESERAREARGLNDDPDARYYVERNPDFDRHYMLMWVPLDVGNLARGAAQTLLRHLLGGGGARS